jgi:hypothetical protein
MVYRSSSDNMEDESESGSELRKRDKPESVSPPSLLLYLIGMLKSR